MRCSLDELRQKEVVNLITGERLGYIDDVDVDLNSQTLRGYRIYGRRMLFGLVKLEDDLFVPCEGVKLYGKDVVLTDKVETIGRLHKKSLNGCQKFVTE